MINDLKLLLLDIFLSFGDVFLDWLAAADMSAWLIFWPNRWAASFLYILENQFNASLEQVLNLFVTDVNIIVFEI